jgi:branched-chain amino acid transport system substrate-binding protein
MKKKYWFKAILFVVLTVFLFTGSAHAQSVKTLKVGTILPLNFGFGVDAKNGLTMLVDQFNTSGGITVKGQKYNVELIVYDDKFKAEEGRAAVERLIYQDKVKYIVGTIGSATITSGLTIFEQEKVLNLYGGATDKALNPKIEYSFGLTVLRTSVPPLWNIAKKVYPNAKTVVFLSPNNEGGKLRAAEEKLVAEAFGIKVLDTLYYPAIAAKAVSYKPDLIDYPGAAAGSQFGLQIKALHSAGFKGGQISAVALKLEEVLSVTSKESLEGFLCRMYDTDLDNPPPIAKAYKAEYIKRYGKWSDASLAWVPPWYAFIEAIKKANSPQTLPTTSQKMDWNFRELMANQEWYVVLTIRTISTAIPLLKGFMHEYAMGNLFLLTRSPFQRSFLVARRCLAVHGNRRSAPG